MNQPTAAAPFSPTHEWLLRNSYWLIALLGIGAAIVTATAFGMAGHDPRRGFWRVADLLVPSVMAIYLLLLHPFGHAAVFRPYWQTRRWVASALWLLTLTVVLLSGYAEFKADKLRPMYIAARVRAQNPVTTANLPDQVTLEQEQYALKHFPKWDVLETTLTLSRLVLCVLFLMLVLDVDSLAAILRISIPGPPAPTPGGTTA
jgi:hypothetical protein